MRVELRGVAFSYPAREGPAVPVLRVVGLPVGGGEVLGVMGNEGSGKSTLLQIMAGLLQPDAGEVLLDGRPVWRRPREALRSRRLVGFAFQFPEQQFFAETVEEELLYAPRNFGVPLQQAHTSAEAVMNALGLTYGPMRLRSPFALSLGEARRVALAAVLAADPAVLLLDEPTAGLDARGTDALLRILRGRTGGDRSTVIVSHDADLLAEVATRVAVLEGGVIAADLPAASILGSPQTLARHGLPVPETTALLDLLGRRDAATDRGAITREGCRKLLAASGPPAPGGSAGSEER